jgi:flagellar motor switch protein FliN/FliY
MTDNTGHVEAKNLNIPESAPNRAGRTTEIWSMDSLLSVELPISISFGSLEIPLGDVMKLGAGSVVELNQSTNDPVTVIVNHRPVARGEMVAIGGNYGIRLLEVESIADRIRSLA